jgi:glycosyltransferase involved in cell wall biosynthesis
VIRPVSDTIATGVERAWTQRPKPQENSGRGRDSANASYSRARRLKVAMMCHFEAGTACGIVLRGKADALAALDQDVSLLYFPFKYARPQRTTQVKIGPRLCLHAVYAPFFAQRGMRRILALPALLADLLQAYRLLAGSDVVVFQKPLPLTLMLQAMLRLTGRRTKITCIYDDWEGIGGMATNRKPEGILRKILISLAEECVPVWTHGNICSSRLLADKLEMSVRTAGKTLYLPGGAPARVESAPVKASTRGAFTVGYVGTFKSRHLANFIARIVSETLRRDDTVRFILIGGGEESGYLREQVASFGGLSNVTLTGQVAHGEALKTLRNVDVCLLYLNDRFPESYADASRSSVKMFEYMALGKPLIASRFGEPAEILRNGRTAWLSENVPRAFAERILRVKNQSVAAATMGARVRKDFLDHYSHEVLMTGFLRWARSL